MDWAKVVAKRNLKKQQLLKQASAQNPLNPKNRKFSQRKSVWGKGETAEGFAGSTPSIFVHNLRNTVTEDIVKDELVKRGVHVNKVTKKSHEDAYKCSFLVEVSDRASFDLVMGGTVLPPDVGARQWRHKKYNGEQKEGAAWPANRQ